MLYDVIVPESSIHFCMIHDCVTITMTYMTVIYNITLYLNFKSKIRK